jgi:hypothetical protein
MTYLSELLLSHFLPDFYLADKIFDKYFNHPVDTIIETLTYLIFYEAGVFAIAQVFFETRLRRNLSHAFENALL